MALKSVWGLMLVSLCSANYDSVNTTAGWYMHEDLGPHLLIWFKFNPCRDNLSIALIKCGEIIYSFPNFNGATVEVWEWISNFIPHFTGHVITFPWWASSPYGSGRCTCLVTWFWYWMIAKWGNKTGPPPWHDPKKDSLVYAFSLLREDRFIFINEIPILVRHHLYIETDPLEAFSIHWSTTHTLLNDYD